MSVTAAPGFVANGIACGIDAAGGLDLALVATGDGISVPTAAVFTQNQVLAAPVMVSRAHLAASAGYAAAVIVNSGNANACTGERGLTDAEAMCTATAKALGCASEEVLVCSTGRIGTALPIDAVTSATLNVVAGRSPQTERALAAAEAIMTTDTRPKQGVARHGEIVVGGMAKGAGMIAPNMATMLAILTTNASADPARLHDVLVDGVADSFNAVSIDGCTSTNDTVVLMANGSLDRRSGTAPTTFDGAALRHAVAELCWDLACQVVGDAEGHTKVVQVTVTGAESDVEARRAARKLADSQLLKCSWHGGDPYWGRVASELGTAGVSLDTQRVSIAYGGVLVSRGCVAVDHVRDAVASHMAGDHLRVDCDLGVGGGSARVLTSDLSHGYVDENMGTS